MITVVQRWGNSLALRIPQPFAKNIHVHQGSEVELSIVQNKLVVKPKSRAKYSIDSLMKSVHKKNLHSAQDWGKPAGKEIW